MKIELIKKPRYKNSVLVYGLKIIGLSNPGKIVRVISKIDPKYAPYINAFLNQKIKKLKENDSFPELNIYHPKMGSVMLLPLRVLINASTAQKAGGKTGKFFLGEKIQAIEVIIPPSSRISGNTVNALLIGILKGNYALTKNKVDNTEHCLIEKIKLFGTEKIPKQDLIADEIISDSINLTRDFSNLSGNNFTPTDFKTESAKIAKKNKLVFKAYNTGEIKKMDMGCFHAVAKGSSETAYLNVLKYKYKKSADTIMLVGKGLTFDTGGYSLKPASAMEEMKFDKCGGTVVLGVMQAIARLKPKINVVGMIAASENMISDKAMKPGDIFKACNGKTVEVINTDAEGRLILCDTLAYGIQEFKPAAVIDVATLTGACMIALGAYNAGLFSNDDTLSRQLTESGERTGDPVWRMPMNEVYKKDLECTYADLKNVGGRSGSAISAAWFLREFVGNVPWAHLDIAGVAWDVKHVDYYPSKGANGFGVHLLIDYILNRQNK